MRNRLNGTVFSLLIITAAAVLPQSVCLADDSSVVNPVFVSDKPLPDEVEAQNTSLPDADKPQVSSEEDPSNLLKASSLNSNSLNSNALNSNALESAEQKTPAPVVGGSAYFGRVMFGLLVVLASIFVLAWLVRRFGHGGFLANPDMKVLSSLAVGSRERAVLVDVAGQQLLLGVAPGRISTLHVFDSPVVAGGAEKGGKREDVLPLHSSNGDRSLSEFGRTIREIISKGGVK